MDVIQAIAMLCALHTGPVPTAESAQANCHAYYTECMMEVKAEKHIDKIKVCILSRPAQITTDKLKK